MCMFDEGVTSWHDRRQRRKLVRTLVNMDSLAALMESEYKLESSNR